MGNSFTEGLFYPEIDIKDEDWLKSSLLFWDKIYTIKPENLRAPHSSSNQYLYDKGILKQIIINSESKYLNEISSEALNYLNSNEGFELLTHSVKDQNHLSRLPKELNKLIKVHPDKFADQMKFLLKEKLSNGWYEIDDSFASFYMTLLANKICNEKSIALLTDSQLNSNFSDKIKLNNQIALAGSSSSYKSSSILSSNLAIGQFINLVIQGIKITTPTSFDDILNFKSKHNDEIGLFRYNVSNILSTVSMQSHIQSFNQQIEDTYINQFLPSYNNLKKALTGAKIKWVPDTLIKISFFSVSATALPSILHINLPFAVLAGAGISLVSSFLSYNVDMTEKIRNNPYSYLLSINQKF